MYVIGFDNAVYMVGSTSGSAKVLPYAKQISATMKYNVYAIGENNAVYMINGGSVVAQGGYFKQISAGIDARGAPEVFGIGLDDALWVSNGFGFAKLASNYVTEIGALAVDIGFAGDLTYAVGIGHVALLHKGSNVTTISGGTVE